MTNNFPQTMLESLRGFSDSVIYINDDGIKVNNFFKFEKTYLVSVNRPLPLQPPLPDLFTLLLDGAVCTSYHIIIIYWSPVNFSLLEYKIVVCWIVCRYAMFVTI